MSSAHSAKWHRFFAMLVVAALLLSSVPVLPTALAEVVLPSNLTEIKEEAFQKDNALTTITLPERLRTIGDRAFYKCIMLEDLVFPASVTSIGEEAFMDCKSLSQVILPPNLQVIPSNAFHGCVNLHTLVLPANLKRIDYAAFEFCTKLEKVTIPGMVESIGTSAFEACSNLKEVVVPASVTHIGPMAFYECSSDLTLVVEPGSYAERYCISEDIPYRYATASFNITELDASEKNLKAREATSVLFTARAPLGQLFYLYQEGAAANLGQMHDDGANGDVTANDGVYSLKLTLTFDSARVVTYYAGIGMVTSNRVTVNVFNVPSANSAGATRNVNDIKNAIQSVDNAVLGNVQAPTSSQISAALDRMEASAEELQSSGQILSYSRTSDGVFMCSSYGLTMAYIPAQADTDLNGSDVSMRIYTFQPCRAGYSGSVATHMNNPTEAARTIANTFSNYTYTAAYNDSSVTLSRIRSIGANSVVLWHGHGGYQSNVGPTLVTGEDFDMNAWLWDVSYWWDCVQNRIIHSFGGKVLISGRYIQAYCGDMSNSLIYLAACSSGRTPELVNAFLNKGAVAVVANSGVIYTVYNITVQRATMEYMCRINPSTGNYYTLNEALTAAKNDHGANDNVWHQNTYGDTDPSHSPAEPVIFGGTAAQNCRLGYAYGTLSGEVRSASDPNRAVSDATINIYQGSTLKKTVRTSSTGGYTVEKLEPQQYKIEISAPGYVTFVGYATIRQNETTYMETFLMVEGEEGQTGVASGKITNAFSGAALSGVQLQVRNGWNNTSQGSVVASMVTSSSGAYSFTLPIGNYTVNAVKNGFINSYFNIVVRPNMTTANQNHAMTPSSGSNDVYRIKLTWGENPRDLDSHMVGTKSNGSSFHVYYASKQATENNVTICELDVDDTTSYGPENITLRTVTSQPYYYYIHHYAGTGAIVSSSARIDVYKGEVLIRTFNVPTNLGTQKYWNVFAIVDGEIVVKNTITSSPNTTYAD